MKGKRESNMSDKVSDNDSDSDKPRKVAPGILIYGE